MIRKLADSLILVSRNLVPTLETVKIFLWPFGQTFEVVRPFSLCSVHSILTY